VTDGNLSVDLTCSRQYVVSNPAKAHMLEFSLHISHLLTHGDVCVHVEIADDQIITEDEG
jgi:hypothetical protein